MQGRAISQAYVNLWKIQFWQTCTNSHRVKADRCNAEQRSRISWLPKLLRPVIGIINNVINNVIDNVTDLALPYLVRRTGGL